MWIFKLIMQSLKKQKARYLFLILQFLLVFIAFNVGFSLIVNNVQNKSSIEKLVDANKWYHVALRFDRASSIVDKKELSSLLEDIRKFKGVEKLGLYLQFDSKTSQFNLDQKNSEKKVISTIIMDEETFNYYRFKLQDGKNIDLESYYSKGEVPIIVGKNLQKRMQLDEKRIYKMKELDNGQWIYINSRIAGTLKDGEEFWNDKKSETGAILKKLDDSMIIVYKDVQSMPAQYMYNIISSFDVICSDRQATDNLKDYLKDKYNAPTIVNSSSDIINSVNQEKRLLIIISFILSLALMLLSVIGIAGAVRSNIELKRKEYGIRIAIGASQKILAQVILGEFLFAILPANIISLIVIKVTNLINSSIIPSVSLWTVVFSLTISVLIVILVSIVPMIWIYKTSPNDLIREV